jgi:hypothetical protein
MLLTLVAISKSPADAAEISCNSKYGAVDPIRLSEFVPSGRQPTPDTCKIVLIKGTIAPGDSIKFAQLLRKSHPFMDSVLLWSSGGSVEESMKIGGLIRKGLIKTIAPSDFSQLGTAPQFDHRPPKGWGDLWNSSDNARVCKGYDCHCASACFLIWAAGVDRFGSSLGLHRPTTASTAFATLPPDRASVLYRQLILDIGKYLTEMEVTQRFIEIMMDTTSTDIRWLNYDEASLVEKVPSIAEWIAASCGAMSKSEKDAMLQIGVEIDQLKKNVTQRDRMLREQLDKKSSEISMCGTKKIWKARDAISDQ